MRFPSPVWRNGLAFAALALATGSILLDVCGLVYSLAIGGFEHHDPILRMMIRFGFFSALAGFLLGVPGKGLLHRPALISSLAICVGWFITAGLE